MQLATIISFRSMLLCGLFGIMVAATFNMTMRDNMKTLINNGSFPINSNSCIFGVESVSVVLFTSNIPGGKVVEINKSCDDFFNTSKSSPIIFLTHGFLSQAYGANLSMLISLSIKKGYTVFALDWSDAACYNDPAGINLLEYPFAVNNTKKVGDYLASYVKTVIECGVPIKNITLVGHSLGAHISGFALKNLQKLNYSKIEILIGIDPAGPEFAGKPCSERFCESDAKHVICLHTSNLGMWYSVGDLDLWMNNGVCQPTCGDIPLMCTVCSHKIGPELLANTLINNCTYVGIPIPPKTFLPHPLSEPIIGCPSNRANCTIVDNRIFNSSNNMMGDYCVIVSPEYPYCTINNVSCRK